MGDEFPDVDDRPTPSRLEELLLLRLANENPAARPLRALVDDTPLRRASRARETIDRARDVPGGPDADRAQRRDADRDAARAGPRPPDVPRRPAAVRPRALARPARRRARRAARPPARHPRRHRRGGARPAPAVRRGRRRRCGRRRPRRGAGPDRPRRRARALLERLGVDAAPRADRQEHARLARPAVAALRARHPDARRDPRRGARPARALGHHGPVADRPVGAQPGVAADQGLARQPGRGRVGLLARRLPDRRRPRRRGGVGGPARPRLGARRPARLGHGPQPHGHRLALGHRAPGVVPLAARAALPRLHVQRREPGRGRAGRDPARGPLLGQQRRGGRVRAARPLDRRPALRLPRQRRHELPVERHGAARLQPGRRPGAGDPDDRRRRAAVPGHPLRRRDGAREEARPAAVVPGPGRGRRRDPVAGRVRDDVAGRVRRRDARPSSGARSSTGSPSRRPDTLLLAEAFWLLEGYFVRTLGMHRVYNSAFMHMLRDEDNAGYRKVLKETLEFDPEILKRYVNFMNNPDEKTAVEQFGKGDKYVGVATLLATLPGLPMFGHGQFEGFAEKYGMEFRRASLDEQPDQWLIDAPRARDRAAAPPAGRLRRGARLPAVRRRGRRRRRRRARVRVLERVGRRRGRWSSTTTGTRETSGWIRDSVAFALKAADGSKSMVRRTLAEGLGLADGPADGRWLAMREQRSGLEYLRSVARDPRARRARLAAGLRDARVLGAARAVRRGRRLGPARGAAGRARRAVARGRAARARADPGARRAAGGDRGADASRRVERLVAAVADATGTDGRPGGRGRPRRGARTRRSSRSSPTIDDPSQEAAMRLWTLLAPLGSLPAGRRRRGDEPGVVRGAAAGAGRGRRRSATAASTRPARGGPPSGSGCCSTWRSRRSSAAAAATLPLAARRRVARRPVGARVPARQPLGRRGLVPPRVVDRAARLVRTAWSGC